MKNGARGSARERLVQAQLRRDGWIVYRAAGSHGCADLVALRHDDTPRLVQVKASQQGAFEHFRPEERALLIAEADAAGAEAWLCWWPVHRKAQWIRPVSGRSHASSREAAAADQGFWRRRRARRSCRRGDRPVNPVNDEQARREAWEERARTDPDVRSQSDQPRRMASGEWPVPTASRAARPDHGPVTVSVCEHCDCSPPYHQADCPNAPKSARA
jgi:Holliday junction resolvase